MTASTMNEKICVVTGATSGIGRATAVGLASLGAKVVIVVRDPAKAAAVVAQIGRMPGAPAAEVVLADLTEMREVKRAADEIAVRFDHVDVLINNAGGMFNSRHESSEGIEDAYAVNHLAVVLLTLSLKPSLMKSAQPRVVIVSSNTHEKADYVGDYASLLSPKYQWTRIYSQTKLRNMVFARALSVAWKDDGITVNALHPGVVNTGLMSGWESGLMKSFFGLVKRLFLSPEEGARTSIFLASDPSISAVTGNYFDRSRPRPHNPIADDVLVQQQLWAESMAFLEQARLAA